MSPKTEDKPELDPPVCNWCDAATSTPGHAVANGKVVACPRVDLIVQGEHLGGMR